MDSRSSINFWEPAARWGHCAVAADDKVYLWGGFSNTHHANSSTSQQEKFAVQVSVLDLKTKLWSLETTFGCPPPLSRGSACTTDNELTVYQFGGYLGPGERWSNALHMFDTTSLHWDILEPQSTLLAAKQDCGMVFHRSKFLKCSMLVVVGGYGSHGSGSAPCDYTNELHTFILEKGRWSIPAVTGSGPVPCSGFSLTAVDAERAVLFGGVGKKGFLQQLFFLHMENWTWIEVLVTGMWPMGREGHSAAIISGGCPAVYISGGISQGEMSSALTDGWLLDLRGTTWRKVEDQSLLGRACHTVVAVQRCDEYLIVVFGGVHAFRKGTPNDRQHLLADTCLLEFKNHQGTKWKLFQVKRLSVALKEEMSLLQEQLNTAIRERDIAEEHMKHMEVIKLEQERHIKMLSLKLRGSCGSTTSMESRLDGLERSISLERQQSLPGEQRSRVNIDSRPTLSALLALEYSDHDGRQHVIRIIDRMAVQWDRIGILLGIDEASISQYRADNQEVSRRCEAMLSHWLQESYISSEAGTQISWRALIQALNNAKEGKLARDIENVVTM